MPKIHPLPEHVVLTMAAGEVVERPAMIIKELIENAIDAEATEIRVEVKNAGLDSITITDNGLGMSAEDVVLAPLRHTTSKIKTLEDLHTIASLGFRGEALASIAHVSQLTLITRPKDSVLGFKVVVVNGEVGEVEPVASKIGTMVTVEQLFSAQPVRKKFLKNPTVELRHIVEVFNAAALAKPEISFLLQADHKLLAHLPTASLSERVHQLFSLDSEHLLSLHHTTPELQVSGLITSPQASNPTHSAYIYINTRPVIFPSIVSIAKESYGTLLEKENLPLVILHLTVPPETLDVNIHPQKTAIAISNESALLSAIQEVIQNTLTQNDSTYTFPSTEKLKLKDSTSPYTTIKKQVEKSTLSLAINQWQVAGSAPEIAQFHNTYLVVQNSSGVILIDQHAAHERILYEELIAMFDTANHTSVELFQPLQWSITLSQQLLVQEHAQELAALGFDVEEFGSHHYRVSRVPEFLQDFTHEQLTEVMEFILSHFSKHKTLTSSDLIHDSLTRLACRTAVKAGDYLTPEQRFSLLKRLSEVPNQFTCPHGRPTTIQLSLHELEQWFKRRK